MNKGLFLEETGGWMECEHCHNLTGNLEYMHKHGKKVPCYTMKQLAQLAAQGAL
jgi:hypothetical protein